MNIRLSMVFSATLLTPCALLAQTSGMNQETVIHVPAAKIAEGIRALGDERHSASFPVFEHGGYILRLEHRTDKPQNASVHDDESEMFYVVSGRATIRTGGTVIDGRRNGSNVTGTAISGGTLTDLGPGDVLLIPPGVAHWVVKIDGATNLLSLHLPVRR